MANITYLGEIRIADPSVVRNVIETVGFGDPVTDRSLMSY